MTSPTWWLAGLILIFNQTHFLFTSQHAFRTKSVEGSCEHECVDMFCEPLQLLMFYSALFAHCECLLFVDYGQMVVHSPLSGSISAAFLARFWLLRYSLRIDCSFCVSPLPVSAMTSSSLMIHMLLVPVLIMEIHLIHTFLTQTKNIQILFPIGGQQFFVLTFNLA